MEYLNVLVAAIGSYAFGAIWYMALAKPWMAAANITVGEDGRPEGAAGPMPYIIAFVSAILVAGMMRHIFMLAEIDTISKGAMSGFGLGLFIAAPWIATNNGFGDRPMKLTIIDGGYATIGCTIIGIILTLF